MRVLIVDDDPGSRLLFSRILVRDYSCAISEVNNGLEALEQLARARYDCVIIDLMMPVMDGVETLTAIREDARLKDLPVMVISSMRDADVVRRVVQLGVSAYVTKPLRPATVTERLRQFVTRLHANPTPVSREPEDVPQGSRVLVVDGDRDFVHFARNCLDTQYLFLSADSGAAGLRALIDQAPAVIALGSELGALSRRLFMKKVRTAPTLKNARVLLIGGSAADVETFDADGLLPRTFVPEQFTKAFGAALCRSTPETRWLKERGSLRTQLISATEQVMGMMLGWEVTVDAAAALPTVDLHAAAVPIHIDGGEYQPVVHVSADEHTVGAMTEAMLGMPDFTDEDRSGTIQEMGNMIAGRVLEALRHHGDVAKLGLPRVFQGSAATVTGESGLHVRFSGNRLTSPLIVGVREATAGAA